MLSIEKAKREDAPVVLEIRNAAILSQCVDFYSIDDLHAWTRGDLSAAFTEVVEQHFHVARLNGEIVGVGMINIENGKLEAIFVRPGYMRMGVGGKILKFLENIALEHGLKTLRLESTLNAVAFYRACGFEGNEVSKYISPRGLSLDCIPMVKVISPNYRSRPRSV